jgi:transcriptional regulator with XRE-family HTH domain
MNKKKPPSWVDPLALLTAMGKEQYLAMRIEAALKRRDWTQERLAKEMRTQGCPIPQSAISKIVNPPKGRGRRAITVDEALAFARVLGLSIADLLLPPALLNDARLLEDVEAGPELARRLQEAEVAYSDVVDRVVERLKDDREWAEWFRLTRTDGSNAAPRTAGRFYEDVLVRLEEAES